jgi:uncharacterized membrane protein
MLGAFLAFGADTLVVVAALWYVGRLSDTVASAVAVAVVFVFAAWVVGRWARLRLLRRPGGDRGVDDEESEPLDRLKQRYANGELSDAEFEAQLDRLLDADRRAESTNETAPRQVDQSRDSD